MKKNRISFIYFDLGGVIIDNNQAILRIAQEVGRGTEEVQAFFDENWREACLGNLSNEEYLERFKSRFSLFHPEDLVDYFTDRQGIYQEMHEFIRDAEKTHRLGILSNAEQDIIPTLFRKKKIPDVSWDVIIESSRHGTVKPEPGIYEIAEDMAHVPPQEILFIDDRRINVETAISRGWHGELFDYMHISDSIERLRALLLK